MSRKEPLWLDKLYVIAKLTADNSCRTKTTEDMSDRNVNMGEEACNSSVLQPMIRTKLQAKLSVTLVRKKKRRKRTSTIRSTQTVQHETRQRRGVE